MESQNSDEFYDRLKVQLADSTTWPSNYLYKFIIPTDDKKVLRIHQIFDNMGAVIDSKLSKKGNYTSITISVDLNDPEQVIQKYKEVGEVEGVISL